MWLIYSQLNCVSNQCTLPHVTLPNPQYSGPGYSLSLVKGSKHREATAKARRTACPDLGLLVVRPHDTLKKDSTWTARALGTVVCGEVLASTSPILSRRLCYDKTTPQ